MPEDEEVFHSESIYGLASREPLVGIKFRDVAVVVTTDDARAMGKDLINTAHAADADAFLVEFLQEKTGTSLEIAAHILNDFRKWREEKANAVQS